MAERILLVQLADIGDLILTTPAIAALREARSDAHLTLLTTAHSAPVVAGTQLVDEIVTFSKHTFDNPRALLRPTNLRHALGLAMRLRRGRYDTTVFFHHFTTRFGALKFGALSLAARSRRRIGLDNGNGYFLTERLADKGFGARHQAQYWLDLAGMLGANTRPRPAVVARASASGVIRPKTPGRPRIVLHPGSGGYSLARRWDAAKFAAVAEALASEFNAEIVIAGTAADDTANVVQRLSFPVIDLTGKTTLPQLATILSDSDLYIGADSGIMHLAAATGVPVVAIFGPSNADAWRPWTPGGRSIALISRVECSPCSYVGHGIGLREGCEARTCMRLITPSHVLDAARSLLAGTPVELRTPVVRAAPWTDTPAPAAKTAEARNAGQPERLCILGVPVDAITYEQWLDRIGEWVRDRSATGPRHVCTVNPEFIMIAQDDPNFKHILNRAALCIPDGVGLLWAARRRGRPLPQRVTGSDGVPKIAARAAEEGWRLFFLGAAPGVADRAAEVLVSRHPRLKIVGTYSGSPASYEEDEIVEQINASGADILFVAFGAPAQDVWIARNLPRLRPRMAMGVGGTFDFIAGVIPRAPLWLQQLGLEWLYRLYVQPSRWRRMLRLPRFVLAVLLERPAS